jgi:hypothetical protein
LASGCHFTPPHRTAPHPHLAGTCPSATAVI